LNTRHLGGLSYIVTLIAKLQYRSRLSVGLALAACLASGMFLPLQIQAAPTSGQWISSARAASRSLQAGAYDEAVRQYQKALETQHQSDNFDWAVQADLQMDMVEAFILQGKYGQARASLEQIGKDIISHGLSGTTVELRYWKRWRHLFESEKDPRNFVAAQKHVTACVASVFGKGCPLYFEQLDDLQHGALAISDWDAFFESVQTRADTCKSEVSAPLKERSRKWRQELDTSLRSAITLAVSQHDMPLARQLCERSSKIFNDPSSLVHIWASLTFVGYDEPSEKLVMQACEKVRKEYKKLGDKASAANTQDYANCLAPLFWHRWHHDLIDSETEQLAREYLATHRNPPEVRSAYLEYTQIVSLLAYMLAHRDKLKEADELLKVQILPSTCLTHADDLHGPVQAREELAHHYHAKGRLADEKRQLDELITLINKTTGIPKADRDATIKALKHNMP
jgi:tetratricopeptide (TPR) repeat protein